MNHAGLHVLHTQPNAICGAPPKSAEPWGPTNALHTMLENFVDAQQMYNTHTKYKGKENIIQTNRI